MSKTSPDVRELLQQNGQKRFQQHKEKQFLSARSREDNADLFIAVEQLNLLNIQKLLPANDIESFQDVANGKNKIDELTCVEDLAKSLQFFEKQLQVILNRCSIALESNDRVLLQLPLTQQYQKAVADEIQPLNLIISETLKLSKDYIEKISENYEKRFNLWKIINRKCAKVIRSLNTLKRLANEYCQQLSILTTVEDQRAFQYVKSINFNEQINFTKSALETLFSYYYFTKSEIINTKQSMMPVDVSILILQKLTGDDLISLSCLSKAHSTYIKSYRYKMSVAYLNKPASIGWQALDYLSYSEILLYLDINDDEPLAKLIKEYKKISQEYGQYRYWQAILATPRVNSFATYVEQYYGLIGLNYGTILKLFELNTNRMWESQAGALKICIDGLILYILKLTKEFAKRTWQDLINSDDELALETLIKLATELKRSAAKIERGIDLEFYNHDLTRVTTLFPPKNDIVKNQFQDIFTLLRDAPCGRRIRVEDINSILNINKWKNITAAILGKPEYSHIYKRYNLDYEYHRYAQPHRKEHRLVILDGMRSGNQLLINKLTSSVLNTLLMFFTEMYDPEGEEIATLILRGIEQGNKLILSKLDSTILELLIKQYREVAVKAIWECKDLHPMLSKKRLKEIEQLYIQYQKIQESLEQEKKSVEAIIKSLSAAGCGSHHEALNGPLMRLLERYRKIYDWYVDFVENLRVSDFPVDLPLTKNGAIAKLQSTVEVLLSTNNLEILSQGFLQLCIRKRIDILGDILKRKIDSANELLSKHLNNINLARGIFTTEVTDDFKKLMECFVNIRDYCYAEFVAFSELPLEGKTRLTPDQAKNLHGIWTPEEVLARYQRVPDDPKEMLDLFDSKLKTLLDAILNTITNSVNQLKQSIVDIKAHMESQDYTVCHELENKWKSYAKYEEPLIKLINPLIDSIENLQKINLEFNKENAMRRPEGERKIPSLLLEFFQKVSSLNTDFIELQSQAQRLRDVPLAISQPLLPPGQKAIQSPAVASIALQSNDWLSADVINNVRANYTQQSGLGLFSSKDSTDLHRKLDLTNSHLSVEDAKKDVDRYLLNPINKGRRLFDILIEEKVCRQSSMQQDLWLTRDALYLIQKKYNQQRGFKFFGYSCEASLALLNKLNSNDEISVKQTAIEDYLRNESNKGKRLFNILIDLKNKIGSAKQNIPVLKG